MTQELTTSEQKIIGEYSMLNKVYSLIKPLNPVHALFNVDKTLYEIRLRPNSITAVTCTSISIIPTPATLVKELLMC